MSETTKTAWALGGWAMVAWIGALFLGASWGYSVGKDSIVKKYELEEAKFRAEQSEKITAALAERDKALRDVASLRSRADRLSSALKRAGKSNVKSGADSGNSDRARLGKCEQLLGEGTGLVGEGAELSRRLSADKEVLKGAAL